LSRVFPCRANYFAQKAGRRPGFNICFSQFDEMGARRARLRIIALELRVPGTLSIVVSTTPFSRATCRCGLTTHQPALLDIGRETVRCLLWHSAGNSPPVSIHLAAPLGSDPVTVPVRPEPASRQVRCMDYISSGACRRLRQRQGEAMRLRLACLSFLEFFVWGWLVLTLAFTSRKACLQRCAARGGVFDPVWAPSSPPFISD